MGQSPTMISARMLVQDFLQELNADLDETVVQYVTQIMESSATIDDDEITDLDQMLESMCPAYGALDDGARMSKLLSLVQQAARLHVKPAASAVPAMTATAATAASATSARDGDAPLPPRDAAAGVRELCALCNEAVSPEYMADLLSSHFHGDAQAAATWMLEQTDLRSCEAEWSARQETLARLEEEQKLAVGRNKQVILAKFDLRPVMQPTEPKKGGKQEVLQAWAGNDNAPKVRYLNGSIVSRAGEKYIIEKTGEEWDGGSRGKVYTKGKRGKGFH